MGYAQNPFNPQEFGMVKAHGIYGKWFRYDPSEDWNHLINACHKVNSGSSALRVDQNGIKNSVFPYLHARRPMMTAILKFDKEAVFEGVVYFIDWYNKFKEVQQENDKVQNGK